MTVPRRTPSDFADIVVYEDDRCHTPYLVVEAKAARQSRAARAQALEQLFGNANSLRVPLGLYDEWDEHIFYDVANYAPTERKLNIKGNRDALPAMYGKVPEYTYVAGSPSDIKAAKSGVIERKIRRSHSIIWAGGKRDPLLAFDEWSKLLFAKAVDEKSTATGQPRGFQIGTNETVAAVANRVHRLFRQGCQDDPTIFLTDTRIVLTDKKICAVVSELQDISLMGTDVDAIGGAFENFFGSIFRGELGQYFTMRQIARFVVSLLDIKHTDYVIDPTAGSGGFLLEALLQVWHNVDTSFAGQSVEQIYGAKNDFAKLRVYGIEIHDILSRICKINLLLHHDGHTNIEGDRSCLDSVFVKDRLQSWQRKFTKVIGNPPFGDEVAAGDDDILGATSLDSFAIAKNRDKVASEHVIIERVIDMLDYNGRFGLVLPDGLFNNQGELSNCPQTRALLAKNGQVEAIVSLPDFAFRKSGAQNKTSVLFFRRFTKAEKLAFDRAMDDARDKLEEGHLWDEDDLTASEELAIGMVYRQGNFAKQYIFLAEANHIGYSPSGIASLSNELYKGSAGGRVDPDQTGTILGEWRKFSTKPADYAGSVSPDCMAIRFADVWDAHPSHRLDPKYHLFKRTEAAYVPTGWVRARVKDVMKRRVKSLDPSLTPDKEYKVMTLGQNGEIRPREAGKGINPPEWLGMYFDNSSSTWFAASAGDVVYSSIDLWKGCIAVVPTDFDKAIVTKEFPIYAVTDERLDAEFLSYLLRSRYYQRAFRAITTGHSNRRRTQAGDFESLEINFPPDKTTQAELIARVREARLSARDASLSIKREMLEFSDLVDGRHDGELPDVELDASDE